MIHVLSATLVGQALNGDAYGWTAMHNPGTVSNQTILNKMLLMRLNVQVWIS